MLNVLCTNNFFGNYVVSFYQFIFYSVLGLSIFCLLNHYDSSTFHNVNMSNITFFGFIYFSLIMVYVIYINNFSG